MAGRYSCSFGHWRRRPSRSAWGRKAVRNAATKEGQARTRGDGLDQERKERAEQLHKRRAVRNALDYSWAYWQPRPSGPGALSWEERQARAAEDAPREKILVRVGVGV